MSKITFIGAGSTVFAKTSWVIACRRRLCRDLNLLCLILTPFV